ncbi:hypothetical protein DPMN_017821 [Dreissena polymorpha]|uniref:Uncharacterized protein n=1 Tax=Dreissena polymorpha TaxID=45954 RepID=A0A9D4S6R3_DREPO|nr:hypothetical protein DPMN_017821 [Dreissena polymorpha]
MSEINKTNVLTKCHDDWAKIVTSRVRTALPTGGYAFQWTGTTFELNQHIKKNILTNFEFDRGIIGTTLLTKFHKDLTRNVASRVLTRKTSPTSDSHVFQRTRTTFELNQHIIKTNILNKHDSVSNLIEFHEDRTRNVASRVFTRRTGPPTGCHVFQQTGTTFKLNQHIITTNILTKFFFFFDQHDPVLNSIELYEHRTKHVASRVYTNKCGHTDGRTTDKDRSQKLT